MTEKQMNLFYILENNIVRPCNDPKEWSKWRSLSDNWIIKQDSFKNSKGKFFLSTVFLGLDHGHYLNEKPILWETMLFNKSNNDKDEGQWRYSSKEDALSHHNDLLREHKLI